MELEDWIFEPLSLEECRDLVPEHEENDDE